MLYKEFLRIERVKKYLEIAAYASLVLDFAIAIVTLASLHVYSQDLVQIQFFLNITLTAEVVITFILFVILVLLYHYERILDNLVRVSNVITGRDKRRQKS